MNQSKLKISEEKFKLYLLEAYIEEGKKRSDREVWSSEEFFDYTGMYAINKYTGDRQILSTGTISYWKTKLNIKEKDVYLYHRDITKKIPLSISYEEWSRKNNKNHTKKSVYNRDTIKNRLIQFTGLPDTCKEKTYDEVVTLASKTFELLGLNPNVELTKFYEMNRG